MDFPLGRGPKWREIWEERKGETGRYGMGWDDWASGGSGVEFASPSTPMDYLIAQFLV